MNDLSLKASAVLVQEALFDPVLWRQLSGARTARTWIRHAHSHLALMGVRSPDPSEKEREKARQRFNERPKSERTDAANIGGLQ